MGRRLTYEDWTPMAKAAVAVAQQEALHRHDDVRPEHLLLGLLAVQQCAGRAALVELGLPVDVICRQIEQGLGRGRRGGADVALSRAAKRVIDFAYREALALGATDINTMHLLLGLVREGRSPSARLLPHTRQALDRLRSGARESREVVPAEAPAGRGSEVAALEVGGAW